MVKQSPPKKPNYTLMRFIWAFKIWILETFPICREWWIAREDMLPRGIRWKKNVMFKMEHQSLLTGPFDPPNIPRHTLQLLPAEARTDRWIASRDWFDVPRQPPGPCRRPQLDAHFVHGADDTASAAMPPPPPPPRQPPLPPHTHVPSLEERFVHLQRDHLVLQNDHLVLQNDHSLLKNDHSVLLNDHRELKELVLQLHHRCLALEQQAQEKQDEKPDAAPDRDDDYLSQPEEAVDNSFVDLNLDVNLLYSPEKMDVVDRETLTCVDQISKVQLDSMMASLHNTMKGMTVEEADPTTMVDQTQVIVRAMKYDTMNYEQLPKRIKKIGKYEKSPFCPLPDTTPVRKPAKKKKHALSPVYKLSLENYLENFTAEKNNTKKVEDRAFWKVPMWNEDFERIYGAVPVPVMDPAFDEWLKSDRATKVHVSFREKLVWYKKYWYILLCRECPPPPKLKIPSERTEDGWLYDTHI